MSDPGNKSEIVQMMMNVEMAPAFDTGTAQERRLAKISLADLATGGMGLAALANTIQQMVAQVPMQTEQLYRINMHDLVGTVAARQDGSGFTTAVVQAGKGIVGNASYEAVDMSQVAQAASMVDPYMMMATAALAGIEQELGEIKEISKNILSFMEEDKKAATRGNVNVLVDILNNYKHNVGNERYRETRHVQVLDIRRDAEKDIEFYRAQIGRTLDEGNIIHVSSDVAEKLRRLNDLFGNYQTALYLYGFSTFLEVMLLENFDAAYLDSVAAKIDDYSLKYRELYTEASRRIEEESKTTVRSGVLGGLSFVGKGLGAAISAIPLIEQGPVDEWLKDGGEALGAFNDDCTRKDIEALASKSDSCIAPFQRNVAMVEAAYHKPLIPYTDGKNVMFELTA
ncbi:hypothetical protein GMI69_07555 [Eggerthellaceae bacterium zg-887]|uniref:hypothetical protein n=1 Tax=Xiamenia xianingshaonis TaxID=2682776 RepID=UPI00140D0EDB|nr:hypothetical protein [Xiamenia xianingshaonis]NHM16509.1 hypothetical protein [Xiamenia xianingshaonis]